VTTIELPDGTAAALKAKAAAEGLSVQEWLNRLASAETAAEGPLQTAADIILTRMRNVTAEIMAAMPEDGASQHDHYIYGWPKRDV
jgi:hypothetical protein